MRTNALATRERPALEPKGMDFARVVMSAMAGREGIDQAASFAAKSFRNRPDIAMVVRGAVNPLGTTNEAALVTYADYVREFLDALGPQTIVGRLQGFARAPFNRYVAIDNVSQDASWVGEAAAIPVVGGDYSQTYLQPLKVLALTVVSRELIDLAGPAATQFLFNALVRANKRAIDEAFIDPANTGTSGVKPAAITVNAPSTASTGTTVAAITSDANNLADMLIDLGSGLENAAWCMHPRTASYLATLPGSGGAPAFPTIGMDGGAWFGLPVLTSTAVPRLGSPGTTSIALVDPTRILIADDGEVSIDEFGQGAVQMLTDPTSSATTLVSMWQLGLAGARTRRTINWSAENGACAVLTGVQF